MAKQLRTDPIGVPDLNEYLAASSDFGFEQQVYAQLNDLGFNAQHGGTYDDPSTGTPREFDIRGLKWLKDENRGLSVGLNLRVAVECKNIAEHFPLLVECVPRSREEQFHDILIANPGSSESTLAWSTKRIGRDSFYSKHTPVGKTCCQVGRTQQHKSEISYSDAGIYPKWSQALASAGDLFESSKVNRLSESKPLWTALIPILVVPNDRLWMVEYDGKGVRVNPPRTTNRISYWVNKSLSGGQIQAIQSHRFSISHVEICTVNGLSDSVKEWESRPVDTLFNVST